jgi:hypothetical protein
MFFDGVTMSMPSGRWRNRFLRRSPAIDFIFVGVDRTSVCHRTVQSSRIFAGYGKFPRALGGVSH